MPKAKSIRVATPYESLEDFVGAFWRFCDPAGCFVPTLQRRPNGMEARFSIELAGGRRVLSGMCVVRATYSAEDSPYGRAGVRLGIKTMTKESGDVYAKLLKERDARGAPVAVTEIDDRTVRNEVEPEHSTTPTQAMEPLRAVAMISFGGVVSVRVPTEIPEDRDDGRTVPNPLPRTFPAASQPIPKAESKAEAKATILGFAPLRAPRPAAAPIAPLQVGDVTLTVVPLGMPGPAGMLARAWRWLRRMFA
jgi:hypothetical protein